MNTGVVPTQPECRKNQVGDGRCPSANPCGASKQNCKACRNQPETRDIGQYVLTGKIYAQRGDGLVRGIECAPGDIQNASENGAQAIEPNSDFHQLNLPSVAQREAGAQ